MKEGGITRWKCGLRKQREKVGCGFHADKAQKGAPIRAEEMLAETGWERILNEML